MRGVKPALRARFECIF